MAPLQGNSGRRIQPGSRPTITVDVVSHMAELISFLTSWNQGAQSRLRPMIRVDLTGRQKLRCPWCGGKLVAWLRSVEDPEPSEVHCISPEHNPEDGPAIWTPDLWRRLGLLLGTVQHRSYQARLPTLVGAVLDR